ncbi:hypothetical protein DFH28DRAFT_878262 [Melampsora americana]|nr:hypothetical protein DFH28DRAFT_878262 [Melampsora americana]
MRKLILVWGFCLMFSYCVCMLPDLEEAYQSGAMTEVERDTFSEMTHQHRGSIITNPTEIIHERLQDLEIFVPLKKGFKKKTDLKTFVSKLSPNFNGRFARGKKMQKLMDLVKIAQGHSEVIRSRGEKLNSIVNSIKSNINVFKKGSQLELFIITALEDLQRENLTIYERLWNLRVLHIIQSCLPRGKLKPIREDPNISPVSRGGLELFLTTGMLYFTPIEDLEYQCSYWFSGLDCGPIELSDGITPSFPINESVMEALKRAELIANIRDQFQDCEQLSPTLINIYNNLLQTRSFSDSIIVDRLTLQLTHHIDDKDTPNQEAWCFYHILQHLVRFNPNSKKLFESNLSKSKNAKVIKNIIKCQTKLKPYIEQFVNEEIVDPYMASIFLSLESWNLSLDFIQGCLHLLHIQESALSQGKAEVYGLADSAKARYLVNQDIFIELLYKATDYIEGLEKYLNSQVKMNSKPS